MKRFTKAALFLAALAVMAGSAAYAALPTPILHPGDLVGTEDFRLLASGDVSTSYTAGQLGTKFYHTIIAPNVDNPADMNSVDGWWYSILGVNSSADTSAWSLKKTYKSFDIISNVDPEMQQDWYAGSFVSRDQKGGPGSAMYVSDGLGSHSFDLFLIRTTNPTVDLEFHVNQNNGLKVGLMGGFEVTGPKYPGAFAGDCTLGCDNFHHEMHFNSGRFTETDTIHWTGTGDTAYYVECCDKFAMVASNDSGAGTYIPSYSLSGIVSSDYMTWSSPT